MAPSALSPSELSRFFEPFEPCPLIWVGFSGGRDSTALLAALAACKDRLPAPLRALHINHGTGPEADSWQEHCARVSEKLGIPLVCKTGSPADHSGTGREADWRRMRYEVFEQLIGAREILCLAHHRDDQAETVLLHMLRGSGIDGLAAMPRERPLGLGRLVRPLLESSPADLETYLASREIAYVEDPSNQDHSLDRNYLRHDILPALRKRWPAVDKSFARTAQLCGDASRLLRDEARKTLASRWLQDSVLDINGIGPGSEEFKVLLREWLRRRQIPPLPHSQLTALCEQLENRRSDGRIKATWEGHEIRSFNNRLWLDCFATDDIGSQSLNPENLQLELGASAGKLALVTRTDASVVPAKLELEVSSSVPGERIRVSPNRPARLIKDLFREARVPPWWRNQIPVLREGNLALGIGDWLFSDELRNKLERSALEVSWEPAEKGLQLVREECMNPCQGVK